MLRRSKPVFDRMLRALRARPHSSQQKVVDAFFSGVRFLVVVAGRRGGKTRLASWFVLYACMEKDCNIWVVSKTYDLARRVWDYLVKDVEYLFPGMGVRILDSKLTIEFPWGAVVECKSAEHPQSLLGKGVDLLVVDEAAEIPDRIWQNRLAPTLRDRKGTALFITTPVKRDWLYDLFIDGQEHRNGFWSLQFPSWDNTAVYDDEEIALARSQHDEQSFRSQYGAEFVSASNMVYPDFDRYESVREVPESLEGWSISLAVDPGYNGACAMLWIAHNKVADEDFVIKEVVSPGLRYDDVLRLVVENEPEQGYEYLVCDIAGRAESQQTGKSFVSWMHEQPFFREHKYSWSSTASGIVDGLVLVRSRLRDADGRRRLFVGSGCKELIYALENYAYPQNATKEVPDKDGQYDHPCDALRYYSVWRYMRPGIRSIKKRD